MKNRLIPFAILMWAAVSAMPAQSEEGMYPISDIGNLGLMEKGLEIAPSVIFDPAGNCLLDGICRVNGCTGSFVSAAGLIITNHHCAYRAIQTASSPQQDLLQDGFAAADQAAEIPAPGYTVRITESWRDVSADVLSVVTPQMSFTERTQAVERRTKQIEKDAETSNPAIRAEVAEMFAGKTYVLFEYTFIRDVRLVFAPPSSIGNFGGEADNWEWPRHTGDFSFMRAYVSPQGSSADYAEENVPYRPKRFIQVAPQGVAENDFVFLLGYPGRTSRHKTAAFLEYEANVRLPFLVELYQWQIDVMETMGHTDRGVALKHAARMRSLANVEKRSRGQLQGLRRAGILARRQAEEARLQAYIQSEPQLQEKYGHVLQEIAQAYQDQASTAATELALGNLTSVCRALNFAFTVYDAASEREKPDLEREVAFMDRNYDRTVQNLMLSVKDWHPPTDQILMQGMLERLAETGARELTVLQAAWGEPSSQFVAGAFQKTRMGDPVFLADCLTRTPAQLAAIEDPFLQLAVGLYPEYLRLRELEKQRSGQLDQLYGALIDVKQQFLKTDFVPDANGTLRMTFGRVEGYSPQDAVLKTPITTLSGVMEKTTGVPPFVTPEPVQTMYRARDFGRFAIPLKRAGASLDPANETTDIPVALLYSTDTTGGNSGSPVLNARGQLVGVNFDRAFEATINDFAWDQSYSRSIGVDIRYALWITGKVYGANHLLSEMGVDP